MTANNSSGGAISRSEQPISPHVFARCMQPFFPMESAPTIAVAVSGGIDSMALCWLLHEWARNNNATIIPITVNHKLRKEADEEVRFVASIMQSWSLKHITLDISPDQYQGNLQASARHNRYALMEQWCHEHNILHLATGHHLDDQAETYLLRLQRGSGVEGLASMPSIQYLHQLRLIRPLLSFPKSRLRATLESASVPWIEDTSNCSLHYDRNRLRHALDTPSTPGHMHKRVAMSAFACGSSRAAQEEWAATLACKYISISPLGYATLARDIFKENATIVAMIVSKLLHTIRGSKTQPRRENIETILPYFHAPSHKKSTLHGCIIHYSKTLDAFSIFRDSAMIEEEIPLPCPTQIRWDDRFSLNITASSLSSTAVIKALGKSGYHHIKPHLNNHDATIPPEAIMALPALWQLEDVVYVPYILENSKADIALHALFSPCNALSRTAFAFHKYQSPGCLDE